MLVPEIALTPAVAAPFRRAVRRSRRHPAQRLSDGERHDQWHRIRRGDVDVVVGTRSAVFAPVRQLGLIVVDEEHDGSYKQEESPRYQRPRCRRHARPAADALVVLGSATPSLESYHNAQTGRYALITLDEARARSAAGRRAIVDMREEYARQVPTSSSAAAGRRRSRRGWIGGAGDGPAEPPRLCHERVLPAVRATLDCPNCSVTLTVHRAARRARCHYCNYAMGLPTACAKCAGPYLEHIGFGTERVEAEVTALFPRRARRARGSRHDPEARRHHRVADRASRPARHRRAGRHADDREGHDFPQVTLVGVISADVGLGLADFRAAERTFQLLTQVAGRAGRGEIAGEAIVQTLHPGALQHPARLPSGLPRVLRGGDQVPPLDALSAAVALINAVVKGASLSAA